MPEATCTQPGCGKAHRARGLCSTHYNQAHQPDRHRKIEMPCDYCAEPTLKAPGTKFTARFCSFICRDLYRLEREGDLMAAAHAAPRGVSLPRTCRLPADHPAQWFGRTSLVSFGPCAWCGETLCHGQSDKKAYCSRPCKMAAKRVRRRGREAQDHGFWTWSDFMHIAARFGYCCAYCGVKPGANLQPDHVIPVSKHGSNTVCNLLPSCRQCNGDKRDLLLDDWAEDRRRRNLPPRATTWAAEDSRYYHLTSVNTHAA